MTADLLLLNSRTITLDPRRPLVDGVAVRAGRVVAAGSANACRQAAPAGTPMIDCAGMTVVPGFVDAHIHLAAYAAFLRAVDCSATRSIDEIVRIIGERARATPPGEWIRAAGYDDAVLADGRHPTRWDLDAVAPDHPVRLVHRSGHGLVLNSRALALAGISVSSEEPPGGVIDRRLADGEPTGLLLEMNDAVRLPPLPRAELVAGMREAGTRLLAAGVTAVQDMTHTNAADAGEFLVALAGESGFAPRLLPPAEGWPRAARRLRGSGAQPVKVMVREVGERPYPSTAELAALITACTARGRAVAVHAVARRTVAAVIAAFERAERAGGAPLSHRIEHAGVCSPDLAERAAALGLIVVSNPAFLFFSGDRYLHQVAPQDLPYLYDSAGLRAVGVRVAAGSDAPVAPPEPLRGIRAAATRRTATGAAVPGRTLEPRAALALYTTEAALAAGAGHERGRIAPGMPADLAVLSGDPAVEGTRVEQTIIAGQVRWARRDATRVSPAEQGGSSHVTGAPHTRAI